MIDRNALEDLIRKIVVLEGCADADNLERKIELLCFALEELKFTRGSVPEEVTFEEYVQSKIAIQGKELVISTPSELRNIGSGTSSIQLQASLLLFLLLNHKERYQVFEIIKYFVEEVRSELTFLDFKRTRTGVTRCYTNTRFAANVLREYGLLRFTKREAFKTWELSLAGFLVAASVLEKRAYQKRAWFALDSKRDGKFDLLPEIRDACKGLSLYDDFVDRLTAICEPDAAIFKTFKPALEHAYKLLQQYWAVLRDQTKSQEERRKASLDKIKQLDSLGDSFFRELSRCIQINDLLRRAVRGERRS